MAYSFNLPQPLDYKQSQYLAGTAQRLVVTPSEETTAKRSHHRRVAIYKSKPAVVTSKPYGFLYGSAAGTLNEQLKINEDRDITVMDPDDNLFWRSSPVENSLRWGLSRDLTLNKSESGNTRYNYMNGSTGFNLANYTVGLYGTEKSVLNVTGNIAEVGTPRNLSVFWFDAYGSNAPLAFRINRTVSVGPVNYDITTERGFRYIQAIKNLTVTELDRQLIVTDSGGADEALHYVSMINMTFGMDGYYCSHRRDIYKRQQWSPYMLFGLNAPGNINDTKDLNLSDAFPETYNLTFLLHAKYTGDLENDSIGALTEVSIINTEDISTTSSTLTTIDSTPLGYAYGEATGSVSDGAQWHGRYYNFRLLDGTGSSVTPGSTTNFKIYKPYQTREPVSFSLYTTNAGANVNALVRYSTSSSIIHTYGSATWSSVKYERISKNFIVLNGTNSPGADPTARPMVSSPDFSVGGVGDDGTHVTWAVVTSAAKKRAAAYWGSARLLTREGIEAEAPNQMGVASVSGVNGGRTFQIISTVFGDKLYSFVRDDTRYFYSTFPTTSTHSIYDNAGTQITRTYTRHIETITSDTFNDNTAYVLSSITPDNFTSYETKTPASGLANLGSVTAELDATQYGVSPKYYVDVTFPTNRAAREALPYAHTWQIYSSGNLTKNIMTSSVGFPESGIIRCYLDLYSLLSGYTDYATVGLYAHVVDEASIPYVMYSTTANVDSRDINPGILTLEVGSDRYPLVNWNGDSNYASGVVHTTMDQLTTANTVRILSQNGVGSFTTDNLLMTRIDTVASNENWYGRDDGYGRNWPLIASGSLLLDNYIGQMALYRWLLPATQRAGSIIHGGHVAGYENNISQISSASNGTKKGSKLTLINRLGESQSYAVPPIVLHDNHRFRVSPTGGRDIVEIDASGDTTLNYELDGGEYYVGDANKRYVFSFTLRAHPNCIDNNGQYTLFYENSTTTAASGRISSPRISKWYLVAMPANRIIAGLRTMTIGLWGRDFSFTVPGKLEPWIQTQTWSDDSPEIDNFRGVHSVGFTDSREMDMAHEQYEEYLTLDSVNKIVTHVETAAAGQAGYNNGVYWASGYFGDPPSGYLDLTNQLFTTTFNSAAVSSGVMAAGRYGLYFIVQDDANVWTGIDLTKVNERYRRTSNITDSSGAFHSAHFNY